MAQWNQGRLGRSVTGNPLPGQLPTRKRPAVVQRPSVDQSAAVPIRGDIMQAHRLSQSPTALAQGNHSINQALSRQSAIQSAFRQMNAFGSENGGAARALNRWATPGRFMDAPPRTPVSGPAPVAASILKDKSPQTNHALMMASASSAPTPEVQGVIAMQSAGMIPGHRRCACGAAYADPTPPTCLKCNRPMQGSAAGMRGVSGLGGLGGSSTLAEPLSGVEILQYVFATAQNNWAARILSGNTNLSWSQWKTSANGKAIMALGTFLMDKTNQENTLKARQKFSEAQAGNTQLIRDAANLRSGTEAKIFLVSEKERIAAAAAAVEAQRQAEEKAAKEAAAAAQAQADAALRAEQQAASHAQEMQLLQARAEADAQRASANVVEREAAQARAAAAADERAVAEANAEAARLVAEEASAKAESEATLVAISQAADDRSFFEKNKAIVIGGGIVLAIALLAPASPITVIK